MALFFYSSVYLSSTNFGMSFCLMSNARPAAGCPGASHSIPHLVLHPTYALQLSRGLTTTLPQWNISIGTLLVGLNLLVVLRPHPSLKKVSSGRLHLPHTPRLLTTPPCLKMNRHPTTQSPDHPMGHHIPLVLNHPLKSKTPQLTILRVPPTPRPQTLLLLTPLDRHL